MSHDNTLQQRKMKWPWKAAVICLATAIGIQLVPYSKPLSGAPAALELPSTNPLSQIVRQSCYDCHSETRPLPWYGRIAPISWWMSDEVRRAQSALNFSRWSDYSHRQQELIWQRSLSLVQGGRMPPLPYHFAHTGLEPNDIATLKAHIFELSRHELRDWTPEELLAWPASPWKGGPIQGVHQVDAGTLDKPLVLDGGLLLVQGNLSVPLGVSGHGAVMVSGRLDIDSLPTKIGPVTLVGLAGVTLTSKHNCELSGSVLGPAKLELVNVVVVAPATKKLVFDDVRQARAQFCRDDGQLGELHERSVIVRYKDGQYVLWDPEFQKVRRADSVDQALDQVEKILAEDELTSITIWTKKYRQSWRDLLATLPSKGKSGTFTPNMSPAQ